jgi:TonB family protein
MKKLKVMYERPQVTDEELEKFMDFDQLLVKRAALIKQKRIQYILGITSTIVLLVLISWWMTHSRDNALSSPQQVTLAEPIESNQNTGISIDSTDIEEEKKVNVFPDVEKAQPTKSRIENPKEEIKEEVEQDPVYIQAAPVNGYANLFAYFEKELVYPEEAIAVSVQGTVIVHCTIDKEGRPKKIQIESSLGALFDKEVIRIINKMPAWNPATLNAIPLDSKISFPLSFKLKSVSHEK